MALQLPNSATEIDNKSKTDVQRELQGSNPFAKNHWLAAMITAFSNRVFDFYKQLVEALDAVFPDTAFGDYLSRWLTIFKMSQLAATAANGNLVATGVVTTGIPNGTVFANPDGDLYTSTAFATIAIDIQTIATLTRSGQVALATFDNPHLLASGVEATIAGADQSEYNGTYMITVLSDNAFEYSIIGSPVTPATGTITSSATTASVPVLSNETGASLNLDAGSQITVQSPIAGMDNALTVDAGAVGGGADQEDINDTQLRMVERIQDPVAHFNEADIRRLARTLNGVTRVFVQTPSTATTAIAVNLTRLDDGTTDNNVVALATAASVPFFSGQAVTITASSQSNYNIPDIECVVTSGTTLIYPVGTTVQDPSGSAATITGSDVPLGTVRVYFMRDNDFDVSGVRDTIPTASEVAQLKLLLDTILPANTSSGDLIVSAPTGVEVDFTFTSIEPNTAGMKVGIVTALNQMMLDRTTVGFDLTEDVYRAAIADAYDEDAGIYLQSFTLSLPGADIVIASGEIPIMGEVTYS